MKSHTILVVDDHTAIRFALRSVLQHAGFQVVEAENGQVAVERAREHAPDLVLMDIAMPVMDGWTAAREIRELTGKRPPILAVTALADLDPFKDEFKSTFDGYVGKPVRAKELVRLVREWLDESPPGQAEPEQRADSS